MLGVRYGLEYVSGHIVNYIWVLSADKAASIQLFQENFKNARFLRGQFRYKESKNFKEQEEIQKIFPFIYLLTPQVVWLSKCVIA